MPDAHELAKTYYNAARAEILGRLALREQVLLAAVTAFGVIGGLGLSNHMENENLLALFPFLSLAFTVVLFRHHWLIADLGNYIAVELDPSLQPADIEEPLGERMPYHWNAWLRLGHGRFGQASRRKLRAILIGELLGTWLLIWGPGMAGLILSFNGMYQVHRSIIWIDIALLLIALLPFVREIILLIFRWGKTAG
ncbi:MAG: hypothetical protein ABSC77_08245 [Terracidiphilus sp.]|jgi:hypothetical protein